MGLKHTLLALLAGLNCACFCAPRAPIYEPYLLESGVQVQDIILPDPGPEVRPGDHIVLHYEIRLADGELVDSSFDRGQPLEFQLGSGVLPAGVEAGILGMRLFAQRRLEVPAAEAYGAEGLDGQVPPHALLKFLFELMGLNPVP